MSNINTYHDSLTRIAMGSYYLHKKYIEPDMSHDELNILHVYVFPEAATEQRDLVIGQHDISIGFMTLSTYCTCIGNNIHPL